MALILKWDVPIDSLHHDIGSGEVVHVDCLEKLEGVLPITSIQVWTFEESPDKAYLYRRDVQVILGAHPFPNNSRVLGSVIIPFGEAIIYHLIELR